MGFGLRKFLIFLSLAGGVMAGNAAAWSKEGISFLGRQMIPQIDASNGYFQVRVQSRVIIRVSPINNRDTFGRTVPSSENFSEKKARKCYAMSQFIGFRSGSGNKQNLELLTRDGSLVRAYLADGCLSREFYAGAYMERPSDGNLCEDRDIMHARTGAKCEIDKFRLLVAKR
ncbi:hypothetical protein ACFOWX_10810 [Sphingorhabdus arenilitoris]|uniref:DUF3617 family protein n=1 Tax=Sphingorhabdus arenilitoris TaxID=1490041 RepID=A0ABV8RHN0_9SPHN